MLFSFLTYTFNGDIMQLNIEKNNFYKMSTLLGVKSHQSKIKDVNIDKSKSKGNIEISLYYYDLSNLECFQNIIIPFELDLEEFSTSYALPVFSTNDKILTLSLDHSSTTIYDIWNGRLGNVTYLLNQL